jgi:hypothetical protein
MSSFLALPARLAEMPEPGTGEGDAGDSGDYEFGLGPAASDEEVAAVDEDGSQRCA